MTNVNVVELQRQTILNLETVDKYEDSEKELKLRT